MLLGGGGGGGGGVDIDCWNMLLGGDFRFHRHHINVANLAHMNARVPSN